MLVDQSIGIGTQYSFGGLTHYQKFYAKFMDKAIQWPKKGEEETVLVAPKDFDRFEITLYSWRE